MYIVKQKCLMPHAHSPTPRRIDFSPSYFVQTYFKNLNSLLGLRMKIQSVHLLCLSFKSIDRTAHAHRLCQTDLLVVFAQQTPTKIQFQVSTCLYTSSDPINLSWIVVRVQADACMLLPDQFHSVLHVVSNTGLRSKRVVQG